MSDTAPIEFPKIRIKHPVESPDGTGDRDVMLKDPTMASVVGTSYGISGANVMSIDVLYNAVPGTSSKISDALALLKQAIDLLGQALNSANAIEADRVVQRFKLLLPKLFDCRAIGDGFGLIINSMHAAFSNLDGAPLSQEQARVIWRALRELRNIPAMSVDNAVRWIDDFEKIGLEVDAQEIGHLLEDFETNDD